MYNTDATFNIRANNPNTPEESSQENATDEFNKDISYAQSLNEMFDEQDHDMEVYRTACTNFWCPWCELWIPDYHSRMVHLEQYHGGEMPPLNASLSRRPPSISSPYYHMLISTPSLPPPPPNSPVLAPIIDERDLDLEVEVMQWVNWDEEEGNEEATSHTFSRAESSADAVAREENTLVRRADLPHTHNMSAAAAAAAEAAAATLLSLPSATVESAIAQIQQPPYWMVRCNAATQDDSVPLEVTSTEMVAAAAAAITTARAVTEAFVHGNSYDPTSVRFSAQHSTPDTFSAASAQYAPLATSGNVDAPSSIIGETGRWEKWEKKDRRSGGG